MDGKQYSRHSLPWLLCLPRSLDPGSDISEFHGDRDLKTHIWSFPTREDLDRFTCRVEKAFKQDIEQLQNDTTQLGNRLEALEQRVEEALQAMFQLRDTCLAQDQRIEALIYQLDAYENHNHRSNLCIRGFPEATAAKVIIPTLQGIFNENSYPRDIICKLHKYTVKEQIIKHKCTNAPFFYFDCAHLFFFIRTCNTGMQRKAIHPLLEALRETGIKY